MAKITLDVIRAYALDNALKHGGVPKVGSVISGLFAEGLDKSQIPEIMPLVQKAIEEVKLLEPSLQQRKFDELKDLVSKREIRVGLPELSQVPESGLVMRFAPFPSGPLHIGNARPLILNDEYVKKYGGKLILVIDDTLGSEEKPIELDAYDLIPEGITWLGVNFDKDIIYKSNRMHIYYEYAEELLKKGYMYVCNCQREEMKQNKEKGVECSCRQFSSTEQLKRWTAMFEAPAESMTARLKTNMMDSDPAFRDRIMFRISDRPHAKLGNTFRVYPLLDFSWAIDDHLLGITHILRGMELTMETRVEKFIWDIFGWDSPEIIYNGHFAIEGVKISKSKGSIAVKSGEFFGWNDPRTWSLQSLRDRGIRLEAVRSFILGMGLKKTSIKVPIDVLYAENRKFLEDAPRYFFVEEPQKIQVKGCPNLKAKIPLHPSKNFGTRSYETHNEFFIAQKDFNEMKRGNYRLMHLFNFKLDDFLRLRQRSFSFISEEVDPKLHAKMIHWLPADFKNIPAEVIMPTGEIKRGLCESEAYMLKEGTTIQFERFGFCTLHKKHADKLEFWFTHA